MSSASFIRPCSSSLDLTSPSVSPVAQEVRERADVVLVPVGEDDSADVAFVVLEVGEVRQDEVDAQMLVPRERQAGIDHDDAVVALDDHHVLPDLAQPPERDQPRRACHGLDLRCLEDAGSLEHRAKLGLLSVRRVDER
jgi:hypothetical protein